VQLGVGVGVLVLTAIRARRSPPEALELASFEAVNGLPDSIEAPLWPVMQLGALAAVPVVAGVVWLAGDHTRAKRLAVSGAVTWVLAKGVKRVVGRGRPAAVLSDVRVRGHAQSGGGYLSGHAAIAAALAAGLVPAVPAAAPVLAGVAGAVGFARIYVGAHLPLDVVGGAALGLIVDATIQLTRAG
jgi:membrane-associated phospholipid phosphatase